MAAARAVGTAVAAPDPRRPAAVPPPPAVFFAPTVLAPVCPAAWAAPSAADAAFFAVSPAVARPGAAFLAADFFAAVFFAGAFLVALLAVFLAASLAADFFAGAFLAGVFFAADFAVAFAVVLAALSVAGFAAVVFFAAVFFATMAAAPSHRVILLANRAGTINRPQPRGNGARRRIGPPHVDDKTSLHRLCPARRPVIRRGAAAEPTGPV